MLYLKCCPRCQKGDLVVERDTHGASVQCLQCGFARDIVADRLRAVRMPTVRMLEPLRKAA